MFFRLLAAHAGRPREGWRTMRTLRAYRAAQEQLRSIGLANVAAAQLQLACERTGIAQAIAAATVDRWMEREPLLMLSRYVQPGLVAFLDACRGRGIRLATLSDYPGVAKLEALGLTQYFDVRLCAQAPEIGVFKPDPRGLRVALEQLGVAAAETLYVGDRADVDAVAARAADVPCVLITAERRAVGPAATPRVTTFPELHRRLFG
jgi:HAD superfamily hydrolase (TIGR01509 family)